MGSEYVVKNKKDNGHYSRVVKSIKAIAGAIPGEPTGLYDTKVVIKTGNVTIDKDSIDCEFDIPFDDDTEANEGEIVVYNLTDKTIRQIKKGNKITITAGYGKDVGVIFEATISKVKTLYEDLDNFFFRRNQSVYYPQEPHWENRNADRCF